MPTPSIHHRPADSATLAQSPSIIALRLLLALYLGLGTLWAIAVPPFEKPDEIAHFAYVQFVATRVRIPRQMAHEHPAIENETQQPPLYYALVAVPYRIGLGLGMRATDLLHWRTNPRYYNLMPDKHGEKQFYAPDPEHMSRADRNNVPIDVLLARLISLLMSAGVVWLTFRIAAIAAPGRRWLPLVAAAGVATLPQFTFLASSVTNDNLSFPWGAATLLVCIGALRAPAHRLARYGVWLGLLVGVGVYVKATQLTLVPLAVLVLVFPRRGVAEDTTLTDPDRTARWSLRSLGDVANSADLVLGVKAVMLMILVAGCIGAPWFARNVWLYHDLLGRQEVIDPAGYAWNIDRKALWSPYFMPGGNFWIMLGRSLVGTFGAMDIHTPTAFYAIWYAVLVAAISGLPVGWLARRHSVARSVDWQALAVLATAFLLSFVGLVHYNLSVTQPQGRYLFHIMPALAVLMAVGLAGWFDWWRVVWAGRWPDHGATDPQAADGLSRRTGPGWQAAAFVFAVLLLAVVNLWALFVVLEPAYNLAVLP